MFLLVGKDTSCLSYLLPATLVLVVLGWFFRNDLECLDGVLVGRDHGNRIAFAEGWTQ